MSAGWLIIAVAAAAALGIFLGALALLILDDLLARRRRQALERAKRDNGAAPATAWGVRLPFEDPR